MVPIRSQNSILQELVAEGVLNGYPRNPPSQQLKQQLEALKIDDILGRRPKNASMAKAVLSGLWLLHGFLDESHSLSQDLPTPEGALWHAVMHRLEGDFWNSKYWYRQAGRHAVDQRTQSHLNAEDLKLLGGSWNPSRFVDLCQSEASGQSPRKASVITQHSSEVTGAVDRIAVVEWESLFEYCWTAA